MIETKIYAFKDIKPQAPVHILIIPKIRDGLTGISQVITQLLRLSKKIKKYWVTCWLAFLQSQQK